MLGLWMISGFGRRLRRPVAISCFWVLSTVAAYGVWMQHEDCGCFGGAISVRPIYTSLFDITTVLTLISLAHLRGVDGERWRWNHRIYCTLALCLAFFASFSILGAMMIQGIRLPRIEVLRPEAWIGKSFPLAGHIDDGGVVMSGIWLIVFYRDDCNDCIRSVPQFKEIAEKWAELSQPERLCFIELPSGSSDNAHLVDSSGPWVHARLDADKEWLGETPFEVCVTDGVVTRMPPAWTEILPRLDKSRQ